MLIQGQKGKKEYEIRGTVQIFLKSVVTLQYF